ncbi:DUF4380 domain-containing protein [Frigoriglobus tundricola]|uniref:DUF4380 domain-containing protein n=1 Tax=Frigoriglobus tundricola TaxID=2774151 RepID=A0A6M5Z0S6_9BACT|nr:DUF4380 domain-containing protein [Frigoriglobus tundricola]QJW99240.1 hypothetical protein FTUN_6842 [Frigoriglobus tundricola]
MVDVIEYRGWKNNLRLSNGEVELVVTLDVGPRVISYRLPNGVNVLKNYDAMMGGTGEAEWQIRGGHRFWLAPEDLTRTYFPDNRPVKWEPLGPRDLSPAKPGFTAAPIENHGARFTPPPETEYGIQKVMELRLAERGTRVDVTLRVTNVGTVPTELAPWGPTVMAPGGVEIIPLPPKKNHPGHPKNAQSPADYGPNQELVLWPYFDFADTRWTFGAKYALLRQDVNKGPTKIGLAHREGWVGYLNSGVLFVKRFDYREGAVYPDLGTRYQTFSNEDMLEMETVGELVTLQPGESAELTEAWELYGNVPPVATEADVDRVILPLLK